MYLLINSLLLEKGTSFAPQATKCKETTLRIAQHKMFLIHRSLSQVVVKLEAHAPGQISIIIALEIIILFPQSKNPFYLIDRGTFILFLRSIQKRQISSEVA